MSTMKKVAEAAAVSIATVSRVINNSGYVSEDLRERVQEAMERLNYQPSDLARSLRTQETRSIGVLIPQLDHPFFASLAFSVETALFAGGYRVLICSAQEDARIKRRPMQRCCCGSVLMELSLSPLGTAKQQLRSF